MEFEVSGATAEWRGLWEKGLEANANRELTVGTP